MNRRCVIFAGLPVAPELCEDIGPQDIIITADAGWKTARALGFSPALALGDFDTAPAPEGAGRAAPSGRKGRHRYFFCRAPGR